MRSRQCESEPVTAGVWVKGMPASGTETARTVPGRGQSIVTAAGANW